MKGMQREPLSLGQAAAITLPAAADRLQRTALGAGLAGLAVCALGGLLVSPDYFFRAWLVGWVYWVSVAAGCLALSMLHHMSHGDWGLVLRRSMEAASRTLPLLLVLALPLALGMSDLYAWARPAALSDPLLRLKAPYLNVPFFFGRLALYFAVWGGFAFVLGRLSAKQDQGEDPGVTRRMQVLAAPGLAAYCLAVTFAAVDWLMSLQPAWYSTMYGVYFLGCQGLSALAFLILFGLWLTRSEPLDRVIHPRLFHDYGKLFLAFVMLWAYFSFSQFLIIWSGNLPEETSFFLARFRHGWGLVAVALALFHFVLPFVLLLSRDLKRNAGRLAVVALLMLVMRWIDLIWQVEPAFEHQEAAMFWMYLAAPVGIGGLWLAFFLRELRKRPLLPVNDPYLPEALVP